jgi:hypothetical protein
MSLSWPLCSRAPTPAAHAPATSSRLNCAPFLSPKALDFTNNSFTCAAAAVSAAASGDREEEEDDEDADGEDGDGVVGWKRLLPPSKNPCGGGCGEKGSG